NTFESLIALRWPARARVTAEVVSAICCAALVGAALTRQSIIMAVMALYWGGPVLRALYGRFEHLRDRAVAAQVEQLATLRRSARTPEAFELAQARLAQARTTSYRRAVAAELVLLHVDHGEPTA